VSRSQTINLFYEEPDPDRWLPFDRYPRRVARWMMRGPKQAGGTELTFIYLMAGLEHLGVPYRINAYRHLKANPEELACVIGKPHVIDKLPARTPMLFGTSLYSHPDDDPNLPTRRVIRKVLVPSEWVRRMFAEVWGEYVAVWKGGTDTDTWVPSPAANKDVDVLIYDKIFWQREHYVRVLLEPLIAELRRRGLHVVRLRYGSYRGEQLLAMSKRTRSMVYLSRHETRGHAAMHMLSAGVPLFAWDCGGLWQDPKYYPDRVKFGPVTSVPNWDDRCGIKFEGESDLLEAFDFFWRGVKRDAYAPRELMLENFTLERGALDYLKFVEAFQ
jgi:hypothetical protein